MPHSTASATRIEAAERRTQALTLRKAGATYKQIGQVLGVSEQRAHRIVTIELRRLNRYRDESAAEVLRLELERLDQMFQAIWPAATAGDKDAINQVLTIMRRRAALMGLEAPRKIAPTTPDGEALPGVTLGINIGDILAKVREAEREEREQREQLEDQADRPARIPYQPSANRPQGNGRGG